MTPRGSLAAQRDAEALLDLARRVRRLTPCRRDPERFHVEKSEIEAALRRMAKEPGRRPGDGR